MIMEIIVPLFVVVVTAFLRLLAQVMLSASIVVGGFLAGAGGSASFETIPGGPDGIYALLINLCVSKNSLGYASHCIIVNFEDDLWFPQVVITDGQ